MNPGARWIAAVSALAMAATGLAARPVVVFETPGHTRYYIDDQSVVELGLPGGPVIMARISSQSAPDPHLVSGQVAADGLMQFRCAQSSYRQWNVFAIGKDGSRQQVVAPNAARAFSPTREGSPERKLVQTACAMKRRAP